MLLKYFIEPEFEKVLSKFIIRNIGKLEDTSIADIKNSISKEFYKEYGKECIIEEHVLEKLIFAFRKDLKI